MGVFIVCLLLSLCKKVEEVEEVENIHVQVEKVEITNKGPYMARPEWVVLVHIDGRLSNYWNIY